MIPVVKDLALIDSILYSRLHSNHIKDLTPNLLKNSGMSKLNHNVTGMYNIVYTPM